MAPDALEQAVAAVEASGPRAAAAAPESEFITGPVQQRAAPQRAGTRLEVPRQVQGPLDEALDEETADDEDDEDVTENGEGDEDENDEDGEDGEDEDLEDQEDAIFNLACAAVEEGDALSWQETAALLLTAEVLDPRLALVIALLMEGLPEDAEVVEKHVPLPLTGERVLRALGELGLGDLVEEAREVATLAPGEGEASDEERELVRTNARALNDLAKRELADGKKGERGTKATGRPLRASDVRARRTSLATGVTPRRQG